MQASIPSIHVSSDQYAPEEQFAVWSSGVTTHRISRPVPLTDPFHAVVDAWMLDDLVLTHSRLDETLFLRTGEMIRADGIDWVQVILINAGSMSFRIDEQAESRRMWQGEVAAFDALRPLATESTALECLTCTIARRAFTALDHEPFHHHGRVIDGPWGRLMADCLMALARQVGQMKAADASNLAQAFVRLLVTALQAKDRETSLASPRPRVPMRQRIEAYIDANLAGKELTPARIGSDLGISPPSLYRAFADAGGVTAFIRRRRLEAIHARLNAGEAGAVAEIARAYGFVSAAHFSRAFRRQFGFAPSKARKMELVSEPVIETDNARLFRAWEERLR